MQIISYLDDGCAVGLEHPGDFPELRRRVGQVMHDADHGQQIDTAIGELEVVSLHQFTINFRMSFQKVFGEVKLLLARFGQRYLISIVFQQQTEPAVTATNVDRLS